MRYWWPLGIAALVLLGALAYGWTTARVEQPTNTGWWGSGVAPALSYTPKEGDAQLDAQELFTLFTGEHSVTLPPISTVDVLPEPTENGTYELSARNVVDLIRSLVPSAHTETEATAVTSLDEVYAFIPSGALSTYTPQTNTSELQRALFAYGNRVGAIVEAHENAWLPYQNNILQAFFDNRGSQSAQARVLDLADAMDATGTKLDAVETVPPSVATHHSGLARGYHELAEKTRAVAGAGEDDVQLLAAINASNEAADRFSTAYIGISDVLTGAHVEFGMADSGRVFIFSSY